MYHQWLPDILLYFSNGEKAEEFERHGMFLLGEAGALEEGFLAGVAAHELAVGFIDGP